MTTKVWETESVVSLTVTVIVAEPLAFAAGVKVSEPVELGLA